MAPPLPARVINVWVERSTLHPLYKHLPKAPTAQTISASVISEMQGFLYRKTIRFRCSSLAGRAGSRHTGEFQSDNDRGGDRKTSLEIYKPQGKRVAGTTHRSKERQKQTHALHSHRPLSSYKLKSKVSKCKFRHGVTIYQRGSRFRGPISCKKVIERIPSGALFFTVLSQSFAIKKSFLFKNVRYSRVDFYNSKRNLSKSN